MSRGIITRPGYLYNRADYSPVIGYFPHQFRPHRTQFVSPTPPRTRTFFLGVLESHMIVVHCALCSVPVYYGVFSNKVHGSCIL